MEKLWNVLVVEPRDILRKGLRTIFAADSSVAEVHEAITCEDLERQLELYVLDLIVIGQSLIDVTIIEQLPKNRFIIIASKLDKNLLLNVQANGARAYLLESISEDILRLTLRLPERSFLLDPALTSWFVNHTNDNIATFANTDTLTTREHEIFDLLKQGFSNAAIAKHLHISQTTVKTHVAHILQKLHMKRRPD